MGFTPKEIKLLDCDLSEWLVAGVIRLANNGDMLNSWSEISSLHDDSRCHLNLSKARFIEEVICCDTDTDTDTDTAQYVFFSVSKFSNWLSELPSPLDGNHPFHQRKRNLVWVRGLDQCHRGHALAIIPLGHEGDIDFSSSFHALPSDTAIRSQVHFLSNNPVRVDPVLFSLPDGSFDNIVLKPLFVCYEKILGACLVKEYVSEDSVVVSGIKRLNLSLYKDNNQNAQLSDIKVLEKAVCWVYDERSQTRSGTVMSELPTITNLAIEI